MKLPAEGSLIRLIALPLAILGACPAFGYDGVCRDLADIVELPPLHWCAAANSHLVAVEKKAQEYADWNGTSSPSFDSYQRTMGVRGIIRAWNGAAFDDKRDRLLIWGGGHNAYGGNEIYAFELRNLRWVRVTDPTAFPERAPATTNRDGTPISRHTYGGLAYISHTDEFFGMGGAPDSAGGGCGVDETWLFSFMSNRWTDMRPGGEIPDTTCPEADAIYDAAGRRVIFYKDALHVYDRDRNSFSKVSVDTDGERTSLVIDSKRQRLVQIGQQPRLGAVTRTANLKSLSGGFSRLNTSGTKFIEGIQNPGVAYDVTSDRIVGWYGGGAVYSLHMDTGAWSAHSPASTNKVVPSAVSAAGGVYGRFQYAPSLNVFVTVDAVDDAVYLYRLSEGTGIAQEPAPTAPILAVQ